MKDTTDRRIFETAYALWSSRSGILNTRQRLKRYTYGDQWGDTVVDGDGNRVIESEWIVSTGRRPLTNNLIRRLVKTIVGRYRDMAGRNSWYDTAPGSIDRTALLEELDSRLLEEFLISGMAIQRVADDNRTLGDGVTVVNVPPDRFFCNEFIDPRGYDIEFVGMLHDMSPAELVARFAGGNASHIRRLEQMYSRAGDEVLPSAVRGTGFYEAAYGRCRVVEVWTRQYDRTGKVKWTARWFTPKGELLDTYDSPWPHASHPFAIKFYPLTDGEIHSFVEDVVDQQRYINRLIVLIDRILAASAKGVLLFPEERRTDNMSWDEIAKRWAIPNGLIPIRDSDGEMPQQIESRAGDTGAYRLLEMELKLFDQTAGVGQALLGSSSSGVNGVEHYQAQVENATIALADIFSTFRALVDYRDTLVKSIKSRKP